MGHRVTRTSSLFGVFVTILIAATVSFLVAASYPLHDIPSAAPGTTRWQVFSG